MSDDVGYCILAAISCSILVFGIQTGSSTKETEWRNRIVDNPEYVAVIKSEVLAQRALRKYQETIK